MIKFTSQELHQNTSHIQSIASQAPVLIDNGEQKQVLMPYDEYLKMGGESQKPFVSLYETFANLMSEFSDEEREVLANYDESDDFSYIQRSIDK